MTRRTAWWVLAWRVDRLPLQPSMLRTQVESQSSGQEGAPEPEAQL
ncbi:hypothetical protein [Deinococcus aerius]|nr:hypothetical protein [Deinococcus aerius]